jgi:Protein of unknown function (DUF998)
VLIFGLVTILGALVCLAALVRLHLLPTGHSPLSDAVSDYGAGPYRRWYQTAAIALACSGVAAAVGLLASVAPPPVVVAVLLLLFGLARVLICFFPTDLEGQPHTAIGRVHMVLAIVAFASVATAGPVFAGAAQHDPRWVSAAGSFSVLGWFLVVTVALLLAALFVRPLRRLFGGAERLYYLAMLIWFVVVGAQLISHLA